jgi:hypothetical protein
MKKTPHISSAHSEKPQAEKLAVMDTAAFFAARRERADFEAFDRIMRREGGVPPGPDDQI